LHCGSNVTPNLSEIKKKTNIFIEILVVRHVRLCRNVSEFTVTVR